MFTGLVRSVGMVRDVAPFGKGRRFKIDIGDLAATSDIGQSIAVNGVCLTVTGKNGSVAAFDAVSETVSRTNLGQLRGGSPVNLEPALKAGDALDGHIMLGHVDVMAAVRAVSVSGSDNRVLTIDLPANLRHLVAEKGSVAIDGISLTVAAAGDDAFTVSVIPHTWENTTLKNLAAGDGVNLEVDVMARYAARILQYGPAVAAAEAAGGVTEDLLRENGFA
ncbi:MAG: riboflavin synthase [Planctomycetaceae bacterium]|nr:riboflavin synthase [Planctomycetaceae bacterium]